VTEQVEQQEATVSSSRAAAAAGGGSGGGGGGAVDDLMAHIYHAELNRVRFMLRAYYRTRLFKIEQHVVHVVKEEEVFARLSAREQEYATGYTNMVEEHFGSVLGQLPERYTSMLQQIEEDEGEFDMVPEPSLDKHVFCRVKEDRGVGHAPHRGLTGRTAHVTPHSTPHTICDTRPLWH
jgi:GINS complex subunit 4